MTTLSIAIHSTTTTTAYDMAVKFSQRPSKAAFRWNAFPLTWRSQWKDASEMNYRKFSPVQREFCLTARNQAKTTHTHRNRRR